MKKTIVGIGEILWDMLPSGKALGGAPANFAYHAASERRAGPSAPSGTTLWAAKFSNLWLRKAFTA